MTKAGQGRRKRESLVAPLADFRPMEAKLVDQLPDGPGWQFEPKWDGFRCIGFRQGDEVDLRAKSGKSLAGYFPEIVGALRCLPQDDFVLDGELAIPVGGTLDFDALQARLHPAESRIRKLSGETPAIYILFDLLKRPGGMIVTGSPLSRRRTLLEAFHTRSGASSLGLRLSPVTLDRDAAWNWLDKAGGALDGVVAKRLAGPYEAGERAMLKIKRLRSVDCVVGGFRYASGSQTVGSLLLGLYDAGDKLDHVGFTSGFAGTDRDVLTARLEALRGGPGFTGNAPGGPSRWSTERSGRWEPVRPELVVEIRYDHVTGERFRHGTKLIRWRPDKAPRQCTLEQLRSEAPPAALARFLGA